MGRLAGVAALLLLATLALHGPRLDRPLGLMEGFGNRLASSHRMFDDFGFLALRGAPLEPFQHGSLLGVTPWLTHPPLLVWLAGGFGASEPGLRLPTVVGAWLAGVALYVLLRHAFGDAAAAAAGLLLLLFPMQSLFCQLSYEDVVLPAGLLLYAGVIGRRGADPARRGPWTLLVVLVSVVGPWLDWAYAFYGLGVLPLVAERSWRRTPAALVLPAACSLLSLALLVVWRDWAARAPILPAPLTTAGFDRLLEHGVWRRPSAAAFFGEGGALVVRGFTVFALLAGALGLPWAARRAPRLVLALAVPGVLYPVVFAWHASRHYGFFAYLGPLVAAGAVGLVLALPRLATAVRVAACVLLLGAVAWRAAGWQRYADDSFYRDLGAALDHAAADGSAVFHNSLASYSSYVESSDVRLPPVRALPALQRALRHVPPSQGARFVWIRYEVHTPDGLTADPSASSPALSAWLDARPARSIPGLSRSFLSEDGTRTVRLVDAREVTLRAPAANR
jgi:hypothetical protein